ncbi:MAG TPA: hypothetical protein VFH42_06400 [Sporolactobacillaceae bacterium]|nr:hypothetical protein [Sporolactobacillaceae bacterium]
MSQVVDVVVLLDSTEGMNRKQKAAQIEKNIETIAQMLSEIFFLHIPCPFEEEE